MPTKKTLVLGASENPARYSNMAMKKLLFHKHPVVAIGKRNGSAYGINIHTSYQHEKDIDTITLYLNPGNQQPYYPLILSIHPKRIIFNPGTENDELVALATEKGIQCMEACTLVMLSTGQY